MERTSSLQKAIYDNFDDSSGDQKDTVVNRLLLKLLQNKRSLKILDVGCGDGHVLAPFTRGNEVHGLDVSDRLLQKAETLGVKTHLADLEVDQFPFDSDYFDIVVCSETIEHLLVPDNLLFEINRVLKSKGTFILTFPNVNQPASLLIQTFYDLPPLYSAHYKCPHYRDYTRKIVEWLLDSFGFDAISVKGTYIYPYNNRLSRKIAGIFPRLAEKIVIVASKESPPNYALSEVNIFWSQKEFLKPFQPNTGDVNGGRMLKP